MKASIKAALISALIFPGLGHFVLRPARVVRGLVFMIPAALAASWLLRQTLALSQQLMAELDSGTLPADPAAILARMDAAGAASPLANWLGLLALLCWIGAIADALWLGHRNGN